MTSPLGPQTGDAGVRLATGICKVKKTCKLIKRTSASLLMRIKKGMVSAMVIVQIRG
jgi:hypothetical protein